jgi:hypothetical protein
MSDYDHIDLSDEPSEADMQALSALLGDAAVWDEPDPFLEDQVVAAIVAEAAAVGPLTAPSPTGASVPASGSSAPPTVGPAGPVTSGQVVVPAETLESRRSRRAGSRRGGWVLASGAAAACVVIIVVALLALRTPGTGTSPVEGGRELALARTDLAPPGARGDARIDERADGTRIVIDVKGLAPSPPGTYYEAWLRKNPQVGVSAGTFHLRAGGTEQIELWSGVSPRDYPLFTITVQTEADPASSGKVVLKGTLG